MNNALFSGIELEARKILKGCDDTSLDAILIKSVFKAQHSAALPLVRINAIAVALNGFADGTDLDLQGGLTRLVRSKVLRSRKERGQTLYEINFG